MSIINADYSNLNFEEMAASIGLKAKHIPMLVGSFLDESNSIMVTLEEAVGANDLKAIKSNAHSIKGSAGNLKFNEIYEMARAMELSAADSKGDFDYKAYLNAIKEAIATIPS